MNSSGMFVGGQGTVKGNAVADNESGGGPFGRQAGGIRVTGPSRVSRNAVSTDGAESLNYSIEMDLESGFSGNSVRTTGAATTVSNAVNLGGNVCNGSTTCP